MVVGANCVRPSNVVRSLTTILESKHIDQSRQRRGLLPATWVEEEPSNPRTPVFQHPHECSVLEVPGDAVFSDPGKARPIQRCLDHQVESIQERRTVERGSRAARSCTQVRLSCEFRWRACWTVY